jgi:hypothetical protein
MLCVHYILIYPTFASCNLVVIVTEERREFALVVTLTDVSGRIALNASYLWNNLLRVISETHFLLRMLNACHYDAFSLPKCSSRSNSYATIDNFNRPGNNKNFMYFIVI